MLTVKYKKHSLINIAKSVGLSVFFGGFALLMIVGDTAYAQSCGDLSGSDIQACQTRLENCNQLTGSDERFSERCREEVFKSYSLVSADEADPTRGSNLEADCKDTNGNGSLDKKECGIVGYIVTFTNILSGLVGIVIVIMIAVGGVQYSTARDDPQQVSAAKTRIRNAILALVFYLFAFAFLQYLIPGGLL